MKAYSTIIEYVCILFRNLVDVIKCLLTPTLRIRFNFFLFFVFGLFAISWAALVAYGGSQARGRIGAVAAGLRQSHSNSESELSLQPTPQLTAMPDP